MRTEGRCEQEISSLCGGSQHAVGESMAHFIRSECITFEHASLAAPVNLHHEPSHAAAVSAGEADGTNVRLWPTSLVLCNFLCDHPEYVAGKRVIELGSGSGAVGLVCAALGAASVTLTDVPDALSLIARNVESNPPPSGTTVRVAPCLWGNSEHISAILNGTDGNPAGFDVILCCEVVYQQTEEVLKALAYTQHALSRRDATSKVLLAYEFRMGLSDDIVYFDTAEDLFGEATTHRLDGNEAAAFMEGHSDDGNEDRYLYEYDVIHKEGKKGQQADALLGRQEHTDAAMPRSS